MLLIHLQMQSPAMWEWGGGRDRQNVKRLNMWQNYGISFKACMVVETVFIHILTLSLLAVLISCLSLSLCLPFKEHPAWLDLSWLCLATLSNFWRLEQLFAVLATSSKFYLSKQLVSKIKVYRTIKQWKVNSLIENFNSCKFEYGNIWKSYMWTADETWVKFDPRSVLST